MIKTAVILCGGKGVRLKPYSNSFPKPLMPVGKYCVLEIIIMQLAKNGFKKIILAVNHQAEVIKAFFGCGKKHGVKITYILEKEPLGTIGPIKNIKSLPKNFLVMNGDVLTDLDFSNFYEDHVLSNSLMTVSTIKKNYQIDYGVIHSSSKVITMFSEKPKITHDVSMGIYAMNKDCLIYIPKNKFFGFDSMINTLLKKNIKISSKRHSGFWLDIGKPDDYLFISNEFHKYESKILKK
ncbi:nucleotidyltransferase family protein [Candidatus Methylopumilus universalis]|jgi:NDP-sugar pyrophosphorylase family protein|uniref:sugar phosphate nucleotidyltransferase n=1 Tax=Candidatus Methylopumilus universalis TaxID=2588536 RepID=UPI00112281D9|nr:sugar phosphate nucleotidyltransferase [Candidatus Methylopumilus universalis]QDC70753.1 nucleotidyltransferase family protein [Candidatus Methylopumilus universalis]